MAENTPQEHREPVAESGAGSTSRGFCIGCTLATVVLTVLFAVVLAMLFSSHEEVIARGKRILQGQDTVEQVDDTIMTAREKMLRGMKPTVTLELTDADLNAYIEEHPQDIELPSGLEDPKVAFREGFVQASVRTKILFVPTRVRANLMPEIVDGKLVLHVDKIIAGKISAPGAIRKSVEKLATGTLNEALQANRMDIKSVEVTEGLIRVEALLKPNEEQGETDGEKQ